MERGMDEIEREGRQGREGRKGELGWYIPTYLCTYLLSTLLYHHPPLWRSWWCSTGPGSTKYDDHTHRPCLASSCAHRFVHGPQLSSQRHRRPRASPRGRRCTVLVSSDNSLRGGGCSALNDGWGGGEGEEEDRMTAGEDMVVPEREMDNTDRVNLDTAIHSRNPWYIRRQPPKFPSLFSSPPHHTASIELSVNN